MLSPNAKRSPAGEHNYEVGAVCNQIGNKLRQRRQMFSIIEKKNHMPISQHGNHVFFEWTRSLFVFA